MNRDRRRSRLAPLVAVASLASLALAGGCGASPDVTTGSTDEALVHKALDAGSDTGSSALPLVCSGGVEVVPQIQGHGCTPGVYESADRGRNFKVIYPCDSAPE